MKNSTISSRFNLDNVPIIEVHDNESRKARQRQQLKLFPPNKYRGKVYCGICGKPISYYRFNTAGVNPYESYRCQNRKVWKYGENACPKEDIRVEELDAIVDQAIEKERKLAIYLASEMNTSEDSLYTKLSLYFNQESERLYQPVRDSNLEHFQHFRDWKSGKITEKEYISKRETCVEKEKMLREHWKEFDYYKTHLPYYFAPKNSWIKTMLSLPEHYSPTKEELKKLIFRIYIYEDNRVEIIWRTNLMRERIYQYLKRIHALPDGFTNPQHRGCANNSLYAYSKAELAIINEAGLAGFDKIQVFPDEQ